MKNDAVIFEFFSGDRETLIRPEIVPQIADALRDAVTHVAMTSKLSMKGIQVEVMLAGAERGSLRLYYSVGAVLASASLVKLLEGSTYLLEILGAIISIGADVGALEPRKPIETQHIERKLKLNLEMCRTEVVDSLLALSKFTRGFDEVTISVAGMPTCELVDPSSLYPGMIGSNRNQFRPIRHMKNVNGLVSLIEEELVAKDVQGKTVILLIGYFQPEGSAKAHVVLLDWSKSRHMFPPFAKAFSVNADVQPLSDAIIRPLDVPTALARQAEALVVVKRRI